MYRVSFHLDQLPPTVCTFDELARAQTYALGVLGNFDASQHSISLGVHDMVTGHRLFGIFIPQVYCPACTPDDADLCRACAREARIVGEMYATLGRFEDDGARVSRSYAEVA